MVKQAGLVALFLCAVAAPAAEDGREFYPLAVGQHAEYQVTYRGKEIRGNVDINKSYREGGREYFIIRSDENDVEYHIAVDKDGVYLRRWRYPLPLFKFMKYTIGFNPPIPIVRFPLHVGQTWVYLGRGEVWFLGRNVAISYVVKEEGTLKLAVGDVHYFKLSGLIDNGSDLYEETYYYGRGYGYIKGDGAGRKDVLVSFRPAGGPAQQKSGGK